MLEQKKLTPTEKKEIMGKIDNFLYYLEDNYGIIHEDELKRLGISKAMESLNKAYRILDAEIKNVSVTTTRDFLADLHAEQIEQM